MVFQFLDVGEAGRRPVLIRGVLAEMCQNGLASFWPNLVGVSAGSHWDKCSFLHQGAYYS